MNLDINCTWQLKIAVISQYRTEKSPLPPTARNVRTQIPLSSDTQSTAFPVYVNAI